MERREDIRAAMQSLLAPVPRREPRPEAREARSRQATPAETSTTGPLGPMTIRLSEMHLDTIVDLQRALSENGIAAEPGDIVQALCQAVAVRPALCRSLLAAYLMGEE